MNNAIADIAAERQRQVEAEGWTPEHDDEHGGGELANAAACYAHGALIHDRALGRLWPWDECWWKPDRGRRRELVKAGALIVAEIERIDRMTPPISRVDEYPTQEVGRDPAFAASPSSQSSLSRPSGLQSGVEGSGA